MTSSVEGAKKPRAEREVDGHQGVSRRQRAVRGSHLRQGLPDHLREGVRPPRTGRSPTPKQVVGPLVEAKCAGCHSEGNIGPFAFSSHGKVRNKARMIEEVIATQRMPPWHADPHYGKWEEDRSLGRETQTILDGFPRGPRRMAPRIP